MYDTGLKNCPQMTLIHTIFLLYSLNKGSNKPCEHVFPWQTSNQNSRTIRTNLKHRSPNTASPHHFSSTLSNLSTTFLPNSFHVSTGSNSLPVADNLHVPAPPEPLETTNHYLPTPCVQPQQRSRRLGRGDKYIAMISALSCESTSHSTCSRNCKFKTSCTSPNSPGHQSPRHGFRIVACVGYEGEDWVGGRWFS
jgi:hypothetical protein